MEEIFKTMQDLIAEQFAIDADEISMDSSFVDDLGADSVDLVELVMAMEEEFDIGEIDEEDLAGLKTVGDCVRYLNSKLGYTFRDPSLLRAALYHSSYANEHRAAGIRSNERLEFLGDAVLGFVTAEYLYAKHPDLPEGDLTRRRAALVCEESLHEVAQALDLGSCLQLGRGEEQGGGRHRPSILADATESVFAAVYLDGGMDAARDLIHRVLLDKEREEQVEERRRDYKTELQELVQRKSDQLLRYELTGSSGPDHAKEFAFRVTLNGAEIGTGTGRSKKEAEQSAACAALEHLKNEK